MMNYVIGCTVSLVVKEMQNKIPVFTHQMGRVEIKRHLYLARLKIWGNKHSCILLVEVCYKFFGKFVMSNFLNIK